MKNNWENFSTVDPEFYILTHKVDYSKPEGQKYFYDSGINATETYLSRVKKYLSEYERALEIGCGIGRLTFPHAKIFNEIHAVDISKSMLMKLEATAKVNSITNIRTFLPNEPWDITESFNYAYSWIVFQHISDYSVIKSYIQKIYKSLRKQGIAQLHFDTRSSNIFYQFRNKTPDFLLPKNQRQGIRRIRRKSDELRSLFTSNQFAILDEFSKETSNHTFILQKI
ncbi:class I SAM-dependent methyltransferase [Chroococcidiopsis sp. CCNUC1]|jgi:cyclopropane fatty-acyl-phospholipid synthase-like methyltransferase|uniref:class I SAM-dependent methyltransferase n=1 Tax=Chroococcidiopsis sp. CCNUC1 TaxID=2653189 RepID=UPI00201FBCC7|nr:class I SAM-dependent methyltransferase [Chroococcidiopsis sp. CCNUC1]URD49459.1 class I SAM-dependent methyltransferase [Chroococcidiopsis sp. CCNUC1]